MKKYIDLIDKAILHLLGDLSSLRVWLIILGFVFNLIVLYLVTFCGLNYLVAIASIALLTAIYTYFFASKAKQADIEARTIGDVAVQRSPEE